MEEGTFCFQKGMVDPTAFHAKSFLHPQKSIIIDTKPRIATLDKSVLHDLYVKKGLSQRQIATLLSSSKSTVRRTLIRFGIEIKEKGTQDFHGKNLPYGKKVVRGKVVDHSGEQEIIRQIIELSNLGCSNRAIAKFLNDKGIPTKQRKGPWHCEQVRQVLMRNRRKE